jgi:hypothetical protein
MVWVQAFPQGNTLISQSVGTFQANNLAIETYANTDHFFNTGAPTEGHHRQIQLQNLGAPPAVALNSAIWSQNNATGNAQPFFRNGVSTRGICCFESGTAVAAGAGVGWHLYNFAGTPKCQGILMVCDRANYHNQAISMITWANGSAHYIDIDVRGTITHLYTNLATLILMDTTAGGTFEWTFIRIEAF